MFAAFDMEKSKGVLRFIVVYLLLCSQGESGRICNAPSRKMMQSSDSLVDCDGGIEQNKVIFHSNTSERAKHRNAFNDATLACSIFLFIAGIANHKFLVFLT